ncbi:MAG: hypothetical protein ACOC44_08760 [Promethearchaeia archaeon]
MGLDTFAIMNGLFSLLFVSISIIVGAKIISKYVEYKNRNLLFVGLTWIGISTPWWPSTVSLIKMLLTSEGLSFQTFLFLGNFFLPLAPIFWMYAFTQLHYKEKQKLLVSVYGIISVVYEFVFLYFLFTNPTIIGQPSGDIDLNTGLFVTIYQIFLLISLLVTGIIFSQQSMKSTNKEIQLKGKLLLLAFISFVVGAILDVFSMGSIPVLIISRLILISAAVEFYCGFMLPSWVKELLIEE